MSDPALQLPEYYSRRAPEYERMWYRDDPLRQQEQSSIIAVMSEVLQKKRVLEVACGTGYWTQFIASIAEKIVALDASEEMIALAREKKLDPGRVQFVRGDAYALELLPGSFNAALANFWFSHVPRARHGEFLNGLHKKLEPGASVFMADNVYVAGVGGELVERTGSDDTFKLRTLADGSTHEVLKNYFSFGQLEMIFAPRSRNLKIHIGQCFWWLSYTTPE